MNVDFEGVEDKFTRLYIAADENGASERKKETVARFTTSVRCPACDGTRLNEAARTAQVDGHTLPQVVALPLTDLHALLPTLRTDAVGPLVDEAVARVGALVDMGLGYLTLDRETSTLSGGESQRVKMVRHLGSSLVDVMYVFDEPTIGLHPRDVGRMNTLLHRLRDKGNTVLVVEHDTDVITAADHVIELGPRAGTDGGRVVYAGDVAGLAGSGTLTGEFLHRPVRVKHRFAPRPARCSSRTRRRTTCAGSTSTSRSACWSRSPGSPGRASRPWSGRCCCPSTPTRSSSTSRPSPPRSAPPRPPGPG